MGKNFDVSEIKIKAHLYMFREQKRWRSWSQEAFEDVKAASVLKTSMHEAFILFSLDVKDDELIDIRDLANLRRNFDSKFKEWLEKLPVVNSNNITCFNPLLPER